MATLDNTQEAHLRAFESSFTAFKSAKHALESVLREQLERELSTLRLEASRAGNRATATGVPISRLGDRQRAGMKTTNYDTIKAFLALTQGEELVEAVAVDHDPRADNVAYDDETGLYTVTAPNGARYALNIEFDPVPFVFPAHMDQGWWEWWNRSPEGRATIEPYVAEQEAARAAA